MSNHVSVTGTFQHGFGRVWLVEDDRLPFPHGAGRFESWNDALAFAHQIARMGHIPGGTMDAWAGRTDRPSVVARIYYTVPGSSPEEVREATLDVPDRDGATARQLHQINDRHGPSWSDYGHCIELDDATVLSDRKVTGKRTQWHFPDDHQPFGGGRPVAAETTVTAEIDRPRMEHRNG